MTTLPKLEEGQHYSIDRASGCWIWRGSSNHAGYAEHASRPAARQVWEMAHGKIPKDLLLRHLCHNRSCVRLEHLTIGTRADNADDMRRANRGSRAMARLQATDILPILRRLDAGERTAVIASDFGVAVSTINLIRRGSTWRHEIAAARMMITAQMHASDNRKPGTTAMKPTSDYATSLRQLLDSLPPAGQLARRARELRGMSQVEVASRVGCKSNFVSMVEDARSALPPDRASAWAAAVGLPPLVVALRTMVGKHAGLLVAIAELAALCDQVLPTVEREVHRVRQILDGRFTA